MLNKHLLPAALCVGATHHKRGGKYDMFIHLLQTPLQHHFSSVSYNKHRTWKNNQHRVIRGLQPASQLVRSWIDTAPERQRRKCNAKASLLWKSSLSLFPFLTSQGSRDFMAEISLIHLEKLRSKAFPAGVRIEEPITVLWVVTKAVGDWRAREKSTKRKKGMQACMGAAAEVSIDAAISPILSKLDGGSALREELKAALEGLLSEMSCASFTHSFTYFNTAAHCGLPQGSNTCQVLPLAPKRSFGLLPTCSDGRKKNVIGPHWMG